MKNIGTKIDNTSPPSGNLTAVEFNNFIDELENIATLTGQTLDTPTDTVRQLLQGIAVGGERVSRTNGQTAQIGEIVLPDNSSAPLTVNLPTSDLFINAVVYFEAVENQLFSVNALTIGRNGNLIMGLAEDMILNSIASDNVKFKMTWKGGSLGWLVSRTESVGSTL